MYNKLTIQDLVAVYVEKGQLQEHEALKFVTSVFQVIREGLERDKLLEEYRELEKTIAYL